MLGGRILSNEADIFHRSTNVYEERSMGVFEESDDDSDVEAEFDKKPNAGGYIAYHARKQLAFDLCELVVHLGCFGLTCWYRVACPGAFH